jgi:hypothetical protein
MKSLDYTIVDLKIPIPPRNYSAKVALLHKKLAELEVGQGCAMKGKLPKSARSMVTSICKDSFPARTYATRTLPDGSLGIWRTA